jgi:aspartate/methionine/tyrosine aminotransferase
VTAGEGFDAPGFFRISYATSIDRLREGVTRIREFVHKRSLRGVSATAAR